MKFVSLAVAALSSMALYAAPATLPQFSLPNTSILLINGVDTLKNPWAGGLDAPLVSEIDVNSDGLKDLYIFDRTNARVSVFLNNGSTTGNAYLYDYYYSHQFPAANAWALLYDYNCDGKEDFFTLSPCNCGIAVYRNTSTIPGVLQFTLVTPTLLETYLSSNVNIYATALAIPAFADIDNDGDMDILGYNSLPDGRIQFHRNYSEENYGSCDSLNFQFESATWGFFKLQIGGTNTVNCFSCLTATIDSLTPPGDPAQRPAPRIDSVYYDQSSAALRDDSNTSIFAIDLDGDLDKDVLIGDISATNTLMVCNGGTPASALMDSLCTDTLFPSYDIPVDIKWFASHAYLDMDNDGVRDLVVTPQRSENKRSMWFYKNNGTNAVPVFQYVTNDIVQNSMMDVGEGASPGFFDYNGDGLPDMVVGNYGEYNPANGSLRRRLALYVNTGTSAHPEFTFVTNNFANVQSLNLDGPVFPTFGDLNGDGYDDMILGSGDGKLYYFAAAPSIPLTYTLTQANFFGIDVGNASTPQLVDLNNDGLLDLLVGEQSGFLNYFQNIGTSFVPAFSSTPTKDTLGNVNVRTPGYTDGYSVPFAYYENGHYDLWVSCAKGDVYKYTNISSSLFGTFTLTDTLIHGTEGVRLPYNLAAIGTYLDSDGVMDMALGIYSGGIQFFTSINPSGITGPSSVFHTFDMLPNPAHDAVSIHFSGPGIAFPVRAEVYNTMGQLLRSTETRRPSVSFDVSGLPEGLYIVHLSSASGRIAGKLIISH